MSYSEAPWCAQRGIEIRKMAAVNATLVIRPLLIQPPGLISRIEPCIPRLTALSQSFFNSRKATQDKTPNTENTENCGESQRKAYPPGEMVSFWFSLGFLCDLCVEALDFAGTAVPIGVVSSRLAMGE